MSQVIDTKVVEMQFDNSKFEKNIEVSLNSLKFLNKNIEDAGKNRGSLDELAKASDNVGISFDNMNMKSKISLNMFDMLAGVGTKAFNRISDAVAGFALNMANSLSGMQAMRDGFAEYELKMGSVQTILAGAKIIRNGKELKDEAARLEVVNEKLEDLNKYSDKTIYSFKDMTANIGKFTNAGVNLDDSVAAIQGVANVAAISGANSQEASRAMYNFSQALAQGSVKLIDWKSINNANMGTVAFKQQLLDTALALKTVKKEGDHYISTTKDMNGHVSDAITSTKGFEESLSHQWLTTDVLTQTLKNYSTDVREMTTDQLNEYKQSLLDVGYTAKQVEGIIETSKKAFESATEVKTFTQMIDTLKESLGSGWAQTWEIVFGDFREAKKLWTGLNNTIDGMLKPIGETRNAILQLWKDDGGREAIINSFSNLRDAVENLLAPVKELWKAFTPNISHTGKGLATISKGIEKLTGLVAKGASVVGKALAFVLRPVIFVGNLVSKYLMKLFGLVQKARTKVSGFLSSTGKVVKTFGNTISKAFNKHIVARVTSFKDAISKTFADIKKRAKESMAIQGFVKAFNDLKLAIQDLFGRVVSNATAYANRFSIYLGKIWNAVSPLVSSAFTTVLKSLSDFILPKLRKAIGFVADKFKELGDRISKIDITKSKLYKGLKELPEKIKALSNNKTFKTAFSGMKKFGSDAVTYLSEKFKNLKTDIEAIKTPNGLKNLFETIKNFIKSVFGKDSIQDDLTGTLEETAAATDKVAGEKTGEKLTAFQKFLGGVSDAFNWLKNAAKTARDAVADFIDFIRTNTPKAAKAFYNFLAGDDGLLTMSDITDAVYMFSDAFSALMTGWGFSKFGDAAKGVSEALSDLSNSIVILAKRAGNKMQMSALRDFAIAVGVLVGAMWVLSKIPADKLIVVSGAILAIGAALYKFFGMISSGSAKLTDTAGFIPIALLLISISVAMIAMTASIGLLIGALAIFPKVIKQYNNLGDEFRTGMDRVKEVLGEIFTYLDHTVNAKYGFKAAVALFALVASLDKIRKVIVKFASKKMADSMADGLARIQEVLNILSTFLSSTSIASFSFINIGADLDTLGMAAMIFALGYMIDKITPSIEKMSKMKPDEYKMAFKVLELIFFEFGAFIAGSGLLGHFSSAGLGKWLGMAATVTLLAGAISETVKSLETLTRLAKDQTSLDGAMAALKKIFIGLGGVLAVIGLFEPKGSLIGIFGVTLAIGALTACVMALYPLAKSHPEALEESVHSLMKLMLALGGAMALIKIVGGKSKSVASDIVTLLAVTLSMVVLSNALRRLSKAGGDAESIFAAGTAISAAVLSMAGAIKIMNGVHLSLSVLGGLLLLTAAIWGVAYAIAAFKSSTSDMESSSDTVEKSVEKATTGAADGVSKGLKMIDVSSILGPLFEKIGPAISEHLGNINLGEAIRGMIENIKADAVNWAQDFIDIGTNLVDGISTAISNPANVEKVKGSIVALGKALLESFKLFFGIHSPSTVMAEQGGFILDGLVQGLMEYPAKLAEWIKGIGTFIKDGISGIISGFVEKGRELVDNIGQGIQNGKEAVGKKASELGQAALKKVAKAKEWAKTALNSAESYGAKLKASKNPVAKAAGSMITGATGAIHGMASIFKKSSSDAAAKFSSSLNAGKGPAKSAAAAIVTGAKSAFQGIGNAFKTFGTNAAEGFRNGINAMISRIAEKAAEMVRAAKNAAKREQNSNSPSKDFMEYGGWAAQGYAIGMTSRASTRLIENNAQKMVDTAKNAASSMSFSSGSLTFDSNPAMSSLARAMGLIDDTMTNDIGSDLTIRPVIDMSDVDHNASAISALFGDKHIGASVDVMESIKNDFDRTMSNRMDALSLKSINKLASKIGDMTNTMNSRSLNNYITVDGAADPNAFADDLIRSFRLNARTV